MAKPLNTLPLALVAILALLAAPSVSEGQHSNTIPRLCFLTLEPGTLQTRSPRFDAFFQSLRELGYVDGESITVPITAHGRVLTMI
jgi:putative ABC transport system substrate-binding protein